MQDDEAFDFGVRAARVYRQPYYTYRGDGWLRDETGVFPPIPPKDGITKPTMRGCKYCGDRVASALEDPICAACLIWLDGTDEQVAELKRMLISGEERFALNAANKIIYGTDSHWQCVYGPKEGVPIE